jgi:hypothetical protein
MDIENAQPAIKSYFFGKGYKDLYETITESWQRNWSSASDYWNKSGDYWDRGNLWMFPAVGVGFAALSVVAFGTIWFLAISFIHIVVLLTFFTSIYILYSILWTVDASYRKMRGIFVACPVCHQRNPLPHYLCPNCKVAHTNLIPNSYGILKRKCLCGHKLPTTFLIGRSNLEANCPNCTRAIETRETKPICIPIIGGPSVGKTCYLCAATKCLIEDVSPKYSWKIRFLNKINEDMYDHLLTNYGKGIVPDKTTEKTPMAFNFFIKSPKWNPEKIMYFYDAAGEAFGESNNLVSHKYFGFLHGFIFIVDPFSIPELVNEYQNQLKAHNLEIKPSQMMLEDTFDAMMINLEKNHMVKRDQRINQPFAIVINKIDVFDLENKIGATAANDLMGQRPDLTDKQEAIHLLCTDFFKEWGLGNFLRKVDQKFKTSRFFTCSALGHMPGQTNTPFHQQRVSEPLLWLLAKADRDFRL